MRRFSSAYWFHKVSAASAASGPSRSIEQTHHITRKIGIAKTMTGQPKRAHFPGQRKMKKESRMVAAIADNQYVLPMIWRIARGARTSPMESVRMCTWTRGRQTMPKDLPRQRRQSSEFVAGRTPEGPSLLPSLAVGVRKRHFSWLIQKGSPPKQHASMKIS